jgi:hypothetical protein
MKLDILNTSIAVVLVWAMSSFLIEYIDPVLWEDRAEQIVA